MFIFLKDYALVIILVQQGKVNKMVKDNKGRDRAGAKRSYARISLKRRKMLINMVTKEGFSIAKAIKKLSLKLTTARFILQKYKETGTFPMKQFRRNSRMLKDLPESEQRQSYVNNQQKNQNYVQMPQNEISGTKYQAKPESLLPIVWYYVPYFL